jgi:hypothetical protein
MATRVLHGIKFFEQFLKVTIKGTFLWSLDEIGLVVYEEMSFKVKVYGRMPDEKRSQKLTLSLCDRWAKKENTEKQSYGSFALHFYPMRSIYLKSLMMIFLIIFK